MTIDEGTRRRGYDHSAVCYSSDEDLLAVAMPFLRGGLDAGAPTVVSLERDTVELVRAAVPGAADITFLPIDDVYARPAAAIRSYRELMAEYVDRGAREIRILGEIPRAALRTTWDWWARYESAVNYAYDEFPLRSMCAYDTRATPQQVLDDVTRTHPFVAIPGAGWLTNDGYVEPPSFLSVPSTPVAYPIQQLPPLVDMVDPTPAVARWAVQEANRARLSTSDVENLVLSVSEVVTNALRHGHPPVRLRLWSDATHTVVTVHDTGPGPSDPFAGLLPADRTTGGLGLWITHQLCNHVAFHRDGDGFTVRLTVGSPHSAT